MQQEFVIEADRFRFIPTALVSAAAPSNIALVKYWGKHANQIPANPSISFTLSNAKTTTAVRFAQGNGEVNVSLDGVEKPNFVPKIKNFIERIAPYAPIAKKYDWQVQTANTFPHSSGIASSASGMAALASCWVAFEEICGICFKGDEKQKRISFFARLGSGSACRSIYPGLALWGKTPALEGSSDLYAVPVKDVNRVFLHFHDSILLIESGVKKVSSTAGHDLMNNHPYAQLRFEEANRNIEKMLTLLATDDIVAVGELIEHEALSLHAMMLTSATPYILMQAKTLEVLNAVWDYRKYSGNPLFFTLDAGANVHLLYPDTHATEIKAWIDENLVQYCQNGEILHDRVAEYGK